jgi:DNA-binding MarR family transcriptional regulator
MKIAKKMQDPEDGRGQLISLQPDGELLYKRLLEIQKSEIDFVLNDVTINEEKTILKFISKIVQYHTDKFEIK